MCGGGPRKVLARLCAGHFELSSQVLVILQSRAVRNSWYGSAASQRDTNRDLRPRHVALDLPHFLDLEAHDTRSGADHSNAGRSSETSVAMCGSHVPWCGPREHTSHPPYVPLAIVILSGFSLARVLHSVRLSSVLMPLPGLAPVSAYFGLRPVGRLSLPK